MASNVSSTTALSPAASSAPQRIQRLDEAVVNRIAAGEVSARAWRPLTLTLSAPQVVQRPANAIKEMMENWYTNAGTIFILLRVFVVV